MVGYQQGCLVITGTTCKKKTCFIRDSISDSIQWFVGDDGKQAIGVKH